MADLVWVHEDALRATHPVFDSPAMARGQSLSGTAPDLMPPLSAANASFSSIRP